ncbi:fusaric acid resistance domain protein [Klebsiella pneumoniae]|uniref:Fusaric acid resistance domain protein n=1 Tax=Klebsiella pneumoniae TaxID=573 RepID=A0A377WNN1_KLEPN|nr:fusaric acid resistance domain protein [Klebsiella pneumoniae]
MHARLLEHASLLWVPETTDAIRTAHESVIGQILTMNLLRIQASGATTVSVGRILC